MKGNKQPKFVNKLTMSELNRWCSKIDGAVRFWAKGDSHRITVAHLIAPPEMQEGCRRSTVPLGCPLPPSSSSSSFAMARSSSSISSMLFKALLDRRPLFTPAEELDDDDDDDEAAAAAAAASDDEVVLAAALPPFPPPTPKWEKMSL